MQAKELFKLLVREQLGPLLRSERFCGSRAVVTAGAPQRQRRLLKHGDEEVTTGDILHAIGVGRRAAGPDRAPAAWRTASPYPDSTVTESRSRADQPFGTRQAARPQAY